MQLKNALIIRNYYLKGMLKPEDVIYGYRNSSPRKIRLGTVSELIAALAEAEKRQRAVYQNRRHTSYSQKTR